MTIQPKENFTDGEGFDIRLEGRVVEYRQEVGSGLRVIKVFLTSTTPRVIAYSMDARGEHPASLFITEIVEFIEDALSRI